MSRNDRVIMWKCNLKRRRLAAGLSLRALSISLSISHGSLQEIERGLNPGLNAAMKIAEYFNISISRIWSRMEDKTIGCTRRVGYKSSKRNS